MKTSCGKCKACESPECGQCVNCKDMPKYGGKNTRKQRCINRRCISSTGSDEVSHSPTAKDSGTFKKPTIVPSATRTIVKSAVTNTKVTAKATGKNVEKLESPKKNTSPSKERSRSVRTSTESAREGTLAAKGAPKSVDKGSHELTSKQNKDRQAEQMPKSTSSNSKEDKKIATPVSSSSGRKNSAGKKGIPASDLGKGKVAAEKDMTSPASDIDAIKKAAGKDIASPPPDLEKGKTAVEKEKALLTTVQDKGKTSAENKASPAGAVRSVRKDGGTAVTASPRKIDLPTMELSSMSIVELKVFIPQLLQRVCGEKMWQRSARPSWWPYSVTWPTSDVMWEQEKYGQSTLQQLVRNCYKQLSQDEKLTKAAITPIMPEPLTAPSRRRTAPPRMAHVSTTPTNTISTHTSPSKSGSANQRLAKTGQVLTTSVKARPIATGSSKRSNVGSSDKRVIHTQAIVHEVPAHMKASHSTPVNVTPASKGASTLVSILKTTPRKAGTPGSQQLSTPEKKSPVNERNVGPISPIKTTTFPRGLLFPFCAEIYICYFCEKEFLNKNKMRDHQKECGERPPELHQYQPITVATDDDTHIEPPPMSPKRNNLHLYSPLSLKHFCSYMDLVPKQTAAKLRANRASMEIDCNLEEMELTTPATPITPRTPTSLISQLSRDDSGAHAKKRLSYSLSVDKDVKVDEMSDSSDSEDGQGEVASRENKEPNLLNIPISSLLGQRIKNYVKVESPMPVVDNLEGFCRTPVKNSFLEKLRKKDSAYPIVYKPRRLANLHKQNHTYKFTRKEYKEFLCLLTTGLNPASLKKVRLTKPVRVEVERMTRTQLLRWVPAYMLDRQLRRIYKPSRTAKTKLKVGSHCEFPSGPTLLAQNIDKLLGLKRKSSSTPKSPVNTPLSLGNCISEEMEAEVSKQKLTLYRCLLYEMSHLKPAVVVEDIRSDKKPSDSIGKKKNTSMVIQKVGEPENSVRKVSSPTKNNVGTVSNKAGTSSTTVETKQDYKTLKSLLLQTGKKDHSDITQSSPCDSTKIKAPALFEQQMLRTPVTDSPAASISPVLNMQARSVRAQTPGDDSLSIISLSSDGDATNPNCCAACRNKCLLSPCLCSPVLVKSPAQPDKAKMKKTTDLPPIDVLHKHFEGDNTAGFHPSDIPSQEEIMYNIPSPVSTRSESPLPPTPPSEKSYHKDAPGVSQDQIHTYTPFIGETKIPDTPRSVQSVHKDDLVEDAIVSNRLRSLRSTARSKSLTPSASPVKLDLVASGSLPNSPEKAVTEIRRSPSANRASLLRKMASFPAEMKPSSAKRKILVGNSDKMRTRSVEDKVEQTVSGNSGDATESLKKCSSKLEEMGKKVTVKESVGEVGDLPVRRSKRKASLHLREDYEYGAPAPKLRKLNSESISSR